MRYTFVTSWSSCALRSMRSAVLVGSIGVAAAATPAAAQDVPNRETAIAIKQFLMDLDSLQSRFLALSDAFADKSRGVRVLACAPSGSVHARRERVLRMRQWRTGRRDRQ
jgi:hypothetical protein